MEYANILAVENDLEKAKDYYKEAKKILTDFQIDIQNQSMLQLFIFKSLKKNENINLEERQTKIGEQNTRKKQFLEAIIGLIDENIKTIEDYEKKDEEDKKIIVFVKGTEKRVFDICEEKLKLKGKDSEEVKDLYKFSMEFGIDKYYLIRTMNQPSIWKYYVVFITGVVEVAVGSILCIQAVFSGSLKMAQCGIFLIRQGFNDIILAFDSAVKSKEIKMRSWLERKALDYGKFVLQ